MERRVRGSVLNAYLKYVRVKWGDGGVKACLKDLGLSEEFKDGEYYHDEMRENVLRWLSRTKGREYIQDAGRYVVKNLGILSWMVRFVNVKTLVEKFPQNYSEVYTFGKATVDASKDKAIVFRLHDVNRIEESCLSWLGVCKGALEMTNTNGEVRETKCLVKGDQYCEFTVNYE
jgi:predicted hydrocarbon binding protein